MAESIGSVLLVGSLPQAPVEESMTVCAHGLGDAAPRLTDGEPAGWINIPIEALHRSAALEKLPRPPGVPEYRRQPLRLKPGVAPVEVAFAPTGYAELVPKSYAVFKKLKAEGKIASATRFQASLPTPFGVLGMAMQQDDVPRLLPYYEAHFLRDVAAIASAIPHRELAFQWDAAVEVIEVLERHRPELAQVFPAEAVARHLARLCNAIPREAEVGIHLCYGNPNGKHVIEPKDTAVMASFVDMLTPKLERILNWLHVPVPIERDDPAYFAALHAMKLPAGTRLYLGLVHPGDGIEGARRRIAAAKTAVADFGVATECGMRLVPKADLPRVLDLHRQAARLSAGGGDRA